MAHNTVVAAGGKQVLENADSANPGTYSMPVHVVDGATGDPLDFSGPITSSGTVYASGPPTTAFLSHPAVHTAADAAIPAAGTGIKTSVVTLTAGVYGGGTAPTTTALSIVADKAGANTTIWGPVPLPGFGLWVFTFPGGLQQPVSNKTLDITIADPGAANYCSVDGTAFNS